MMDQFFSKIIKNGKKMTKNEEKPCSTFDFTKGKVKFQHAEILDLKIYLYIFREVERVTGSSHVSQKGRFHFFSSHR